MRHIIVPLFPYNIIISHIREKSKMAKCTNYRGKNYATCHLDKKIESHRRFATRPLYHIFAILSIGKIHKKISGKPLFFLRGCETLVKLHKNSELNLCTFHKFFVGLHKSAAKNLVHLHKKSPLIRGLNYYWVYRIIRCLWCHLSFQRFPHQLRKLQNMTFS